MLPPLVLTADFGGGNMKRNLGVLALLALGAVAGGTWARSSNGHIPEYIKSAVNDPTRPQSDRKRDLNRKPEQVLAFAHVRPGLKIAELEPARGYYTRILCKAVGSSGHIYAINFILHFTPEQLKRMGGRMMGPTPAPQTDCDNVTYSVQAATALTLPSDLDMVWTTENYHDFHNPEFGSPDMRTLDQTIFNALKPGGVFIIEDHAAAAGTGARDTNTLHRIDPALVKKEVESVGFKFAGQSSVLRNPNDNHSEIVFKMVDRTDRFLFRFRKPKA
jgi:predicted methyltransferase